MLVGDFHDILEIENRRVFITGSVEVDGSCSFANGGFQLISGGAPVVADHDDAATENRQAALVVVVLSRLEEDIVGNPPGVGQLFHLGGIANGHAGGGGKRERGSASGRDKGRLGADEFGNRLSRLHKELPHVDIVSIGRDHRLLDGWRDAGPSNDGLVSGGVDYGFAPEVAIELGWIHEGLTSSRFEASYSIARVI